MPRYEVIATGFRCHNETRDNIFEFDGKRDEVELRAAITIRTPTGREVKTETTSALMGDTWRLPGRMQAGSASNYGGIRTGDSFPNSLPFVYSGTLSNSRVPPWQVWEGDLEPNGDSVQIGISIWEWDGGTSSWEGWRELVATTDTRYGDQAKTAFGAIWPAAIPVFPVVSVIVQTAASFTGLWSAYKELSRPIGLQRDPNNADGSQFPLQFLMLDAETAAAASRLRVGGFPEGTTELRYTDDPWLGGDYSIYVLVREVAGAASLPSHDWALLRETSDSRTYVLFGGARFLVADDAVMDRLYGGRARIQVVPNGYLSRFPDGRPVDGTVLREEGSPSIWVVYGGSRSQVMTEADVRVLAPRLNSIGVIPVGGLSGLSIAEPYRREPVRLGRRDRRESVTDTVITVGGRRRPA